MCGYLISIERPKFEEAFISRASAILKLRGPDDYTEYHSGSISALHSRLAIQESTNFDRQPYIVDNRYLLVYNGEIYNYIELRKDLQARSISFEGDGDTEVLARGMAHEGISFIKKLNGMFSFAFTDLKSRETILCRDRLGIKPLAYSLDSGLIASTNSRLVAYAVNSKLNESVLSEVLNFRYELGTNTVFSNVHTLAPGTYLKWSPQKGATTESYWDLTGPSATRDSRDFNMEFEGLINESILLRTRSKRPITSLLSSGLDSSYLTLKANEYGALSECYTLELLENNVDVNGAQKIAARANLSHNILNTSEKGEDFWPKHWDLALLNLDSPVTDTIIGPTSYLFSQISEKYQVVLSGEGADELLAGYVHYALLKKLLWLKNLGHLSSALAAKFLSLFWSVVKGLSPYPGKFGQVELEKLKLFLKTQNPAKAYEVLISIGAGHPYFLKERPEDLSLKAAQVFDLAHWLPNYTLRRLDSLSSCYGVEARVPYLDHRLVELVMNSPSAYLDSKMGDKAPLRRAHYKNFKDYNIWKNPKTPFVLSNRDTFTKGSKEIIRACLLETKSQSKTLSEFVAENKLVSMLEGGKDLSPLETKAIFSAYFTARWLKIQSERRFLAY